MLQSTRGLTHSTTRRITDAAASCPQQQRRRSCAAGAAAAAAAAPLPPFRSGSQPQQRSSSSRGRQVVARARGDEEEPDWDKEMSIFKQRTMRPNQLATLRELESKVNLGRVLWCEDCLAIMKGINPDAPIGTKLAFVSGGSGILLWHRSDNLAFAIIAGGSVQPGEGVECKIKGILQVLDETAGPITRKDYELMQAPAGESLYGAVVNYIGQPIAEIDTPANRKLAAAHKEAVLARATAITEVSSAAVGAAENAAAESQRPLVTTSWDEEGGGPDVAGSGMSAVGLERLKPLINQQVAMKNREQITESLFTGVKALDTLTPLGRGASLLVIGPHNSGKTTLAVDAILGQRASGVKCVVASTTLDAQALEARLKDLESQDCLDGTTAVFFAAPDAPLGTKLATIFAAAAAGERVRDEGGHALVILDDISSLSNTWDKLVLALADLGQEKLREGLIKDEAGNDVALLSPQTEQELVDYEGMLVSGAVAQRRGFFSTLFLRAAKLHAAFGGGSMTLLPLVPGRPASGTSKIVNGGSGGSLDMSKYTTLSEEQKQKLAEVLEKRKAAEAAVMGLSVSPGELKSETVEEFISISDGQVVLEPPMSMPSSSSSSSSSSDASSSTSSSSSSSSPQPSPPTPYSISPKLSITRIGSRAYSKALEQLAPQIRLELAQAEDARRFATNRDDPVLRKYEAYSQRLSAALTQQPGSPVPLEELSVILYAVQEGLVTTDACAPSAVGGLLQQGLDWLRQHSPQVLTSIASSKQLTAAAEKGVREAFAAVLAQQQQQRQQPS